ncbi:hypothetical protein [Niabella drilacis]|uniref:hypothetical protein n=1 Tax=Niabella drilacis (strain DSM 25811 / CCM 8410 / CCUG 62505 / LMG 26954 / E90) TaxID=1285928 RepID=UPI001FDFFA50|nr:hypothetical protein [Niabella drilacis]
MGLSNKWVRWGLLNLAIVALYGTLMRYKIAYNFPFFEQKNLLHAHSHFAFGGWVSHLLYTGLTLLVTPFVTAGRRKQYQALVFLNLLGSFGMLVAFTIEGYKAVSIAFSTLSILVAVVFAGIFIRDRRCWPASHPSVPWAAGGLLLNVVSSAGPFSLAYMMATGNVDSSLYLGSIYFYLHFQYNGWFFLGSMALAAALLPPAFFSLKGYFRIFIIAAIPSFFLSVHWAGIPWWLYLATIMAALLQLGAWIVLLVRAKAWYHQNRPARPSYRKHLFFYAAAFALTIKFVLQALSAIPWLSRLVFGFRPIVIAYLHLVLLGVYSLFLIGYYVARQMIRITPVAKAAALLLLIGVICNELFLAVQGFAALAYIPVPFVNELLLGAAVLLLGGAAGLYISQYRKQKAGGY